MGVKQSALPTAVMQVHRQGGHGTTAEADLLVDLR